MTAAVRRRSCAVTDLEVAYGEARALFGVSFDVRAGSVTTVLGANGAGQVVARGGDRRRRQAERRTRSSSTGRTSPAWSAHRDLQARAGVRARVAQHLPAPLGAATTSGRRCGSPVPRSAAQGRARPCVRDVPGARRTPASAGGHAVGRRAADAQPRPGAGGAAEAAHRRRDVARPRAADGRPRVRVARKAARRGRHRAAHRAVRGARARASPTRR